MNQDKSNTPSSSSTPWGPMAIGGVPWTWLVVCGLSQIAMILVTWNTWQVRETPINLSWFEGSTSDDLIPDLNFAVPLLIAVAFCWVRPRFGFAVQLLVWIAAIAADQLRCQPQVIGLLVLSAACIFPTFRRLALWYLISMWLWAGVHKLLSPDWFGWVSYYLLAMTPDLQKNHQMLAAVVAWWEIGLAGMAIWKPRLAAYPCVLLHLGIVVLLILIQWNFSVIPWNLATALVGWWLLRSAVKDQQLQEVQKAGPAGQEFSRWPEATWESLVVVLLLLSPLGFYTGTLRHGLAHVLYSDNCPIATSSTRDGGAEIATIETLGVPFPRFESSYQRWFLYSDTQPGDKLSIWFPGRSQGHYQYWLRTRDSLQPINAADFFAGKIDLASGRSIGPQVAGFAPDNQNAVVELAKAEVELLKRSEQGTVYALRFPPETYAPELLRQLAGLPNVEQIQLAGCPVTDQDLTLLPPLYRLMAIGLNDTEVTNAGLKELQRYRYLTKIECQNTELSPIAVLQFLDSRDWSLAK